MSAAELLYTFRDYGPSVLEREREQVVTLPVYRDGAIVAPTASGSSYKLYSPSGLLVHTGTLTVAGSIATVTIPASALPSTLDLSDGYREEWVLVLPDGTTRPKTRAAAVARRQLNPVIADADLVAEYPDILRDLPAGETTFQGFVDEAWKRILARMRGVGTLPQLVYTDYELRDAHRELVLFLIAKWWEFKGTSVESWRTMREYHWTAYEAAWTRAKVAVDVDGDGTPDGDGDIGLGGVVHLNVAPVRTSVRSGRW